jgi:hypothetical protein
MRFMRQPLSCVYVCVSRHSGNFRGLCSAVCVTAIIKHTEPHTRVTRRGHNACTACDGGHAWKAPAFGLLDSRVSLTRMPDAYSCFCSAQQTLLRCVVACVNAAQDKLFDTKRPHELADAKWLMHHLYMMSTMHAWFKTTASLRPCLRA